MLLCSAKLEPDLYRDLAFISILTIKCVLGKQEKKKKRNKRTNSCPMRVGGKILGSLKVEVNMGHLPAGPMSKMPHSQSRGPGYDPWVGKIP